MLILVKTHTAVCIRAAEVGDRNRLAAGFIGIVKKRKKRKEVTDLEVKLLSCWLLLRDSAGNPSGPGALLFVLEPCEVQRVLMKHLGRRLNLWIIVVVAD